MIETCDKCKWSVVIGVHKEGNLQLAECRRYPPIGQIIPMPQGPQTVTFFPRVDQKMGCGEFAIGIIVN